MGWKALKEHYRIEHLVQVTDAGICIGSQFIHNIIMVSLDGKLLKRDSGFANDELRRYQQEMDADPAKLRELVLMPDQFASSLPVYTYEGGKIVEKRCEEYGWPNVTHDGQMMYENTFSKDKRKVVKWAKENAKAGIRLWLEREEQLKADLAQVELRLREGVSDLLQLDADYPT